MWRWKQVVRTSFGALFNKAWRKAASAENAISGFRATGVYPFNLEVIPDYAFSQDSAGKKDEKKAVGKIKTEKVQKKPTNRTPRRKRPIITISGSNDNDEEPVLNDFLDEDLTKEEDSCVGCGENYYLTPPSEDWIQCVFYNLWVHENCTEFVGKSMWKEA